jgi:hypothetical protein
MGSNSNGKTFDLNYPKIFGTRKYYMKMDNR